MIIRKKLLALLGVGASLFVLADAAHAAAGRTFSPVSGWSVNKVNPTSGGTPYCTLGRRFDGNTVITFARNTDGEGTVAVDFQQPLFEQNQTYRIALQAGNGLEREFLTRPATPNALVLRTGQDTQFFSALSQASELGVILDNARYAFAMPDFSAGEGQLTGCIGQSPAAMPRTPATAADSAAISQLRNELEALRRENANIVSSLRQEAATPPPQRAAMESSAENDALLAKLAKLESEKGALVEKLQGEQTRQQQDVQDVEELRKALADQKSLKQMLDTERQQRAELEQALQEKTAEAEKRGELRARIEQLEASNGELKSLRESLDSERKKRMAAEASLEDQERLRSRLTELETQNKVLQETASQAETAKTQLQSVESRAISEQARREAAENALKEIQLSVSEREAALARLKDQMDAERKKMEEAEVAKEMALSRQHADELARLNAEVERLRAQGDASSVEQARRLAAEKTLKDMQVTVSERENAMERLRAQMEAERVKLSEAATAKEAELAKLREEGQRQGETMSAEQARREAAEKELNAARAALAEKEAAIARMNGEVAAAKAEKEVTLAKLNDEVAAAKAEKEVTLAKLNAEKEATLAKLNAEVEAAKAEAAKAKAIAADDSKIREMASKLAALQGSNTDLVTQLQTAKARTMQAEKTAAQMVPGDEAERKLAEINARAEADRKELTAMLETEKTRRAKLEEIASKSGSVETRMREMEAQFAEIQKRNADLETSLKEEQERAKLAAASADAEKALRKQLDMMKADNVMLSEKLAQAAKAPAAEEKLAEIRKAAETERRELQALLDAEKARREKVEALMASRGDEPKADANTKDMDRKIADLQKRNTELEDMLNSKAPAAGGSQDDGSEELRRQLEALKQDNAMLAEKLEKAAKAEGGPVVYEGDEQLADALTETKTSLEAALAERDEYRDLLQRERLEGKDGKKDGKAAPKGVNAQIVALEEERVQLIRQLEYERSRNEQIAKGGDVAPASGKNEKDINARLAQLESEKARLKKQLDVAQRDIILARKGGGAASGTDVAELLSENRKLQAELAASAKGGKTMDVKALETEVASLRAQNKVLSDEINKRLAAAPARAEMDNVAAAADYKVREAQTGARAAVADQMAQVESRLSAIESENIRLAKALANERGKQAAVAQVVEVPVQASPQVQGVPQARMAAVEAENIRLSKELANARSKIAVAPIVATDNAADEAMATTAPAAQAEMPVAMAQAPAVAPVQRHQAAPAVPQAAYTPVSLQAQDSGPNGQDIENYLRRAGVSLVSGLEKVRKVSNAQFAAFRWDTGVVFGTAEQRRMGANGGFEQGVQAYLSKTRQRCSGTFDESFDPSQMSTHKTLAVADVACVMPDGTGAGAAVIFFYKDGMFNVVAHEGDISQFGQAMSTRDTLARFLGGIL